MLNSFMYLRSTDAACASASELLESEVKLDNQMKINYGETCIRRAGSLLVQRISRTN